MDALAAPRSSSGSLTPHLSYGALNCHELGQPAELILCFRVFCPWPESPVVSPDPRIKYFMFRPIYGDEEAKNMIEPEDQDFYGMGGGPKPFESSG